MTFGFLLGGLIDFAIGSSESESATTIRLFLANMNYNENKQIPAIGSSSLSTSIDKLSSLSSSFSFGTYPSSSSSLESRRRRN